MDDGAITVVPDIAHDPTPAQVQLFNASEPKNYRWRIMDKDAAVLDEPICEAGDEDSENDLFVRDLDGKRLHFKNDARPRARYLYFLFCVAVLKRAWKHEHRNVPDAVLKSQLGKGVWATLGGYMSKGFLSALATEIGHDTSVFGKDVEPDPVGIL
jgi:hypothetical protein